MANNTYLLIHNPLLDSAKFRMMEKFKIYRGSMVLKILSFLLIVCSGLQAESNFPANNIDPVETKFFILTIPKSGSHLIMKLITMLTGREYNDYLHSNTSLKAFYFIGDKPNAFLNVDCFAKEITKIWEDNSYPLSHFNFGPVIKDYLVFNPDYVPIIQIRDLRDVCVSCVFVFRKEIASEIGSDSFDDQLMYIITMGNKIPDNSITNIYRNAEEAISWCQDENVIISRFEDLIGLEGGGTLEAQHLQISTIANALSIYLNETELHDISANLFGIQNGTKLNSTFRQGKIGSWKDCFTKEHINAFNDHMGHLQTALGYSLD